MTNSQFSISAVTARQHSIADGVTLNIAEATQQLLKRTQDHSYPQILESQLERRQHMKGARLLSFLMAHPGDEFHCCRLHIMLWPPRLDHWKPLVEQLDGSILQDAEQDQAGRALALRSGQKVQTMAQKGLDEYDLAQIVCTRAWDNPITDAQTLKEIKHRLAYLKEYAKSDASEHVIPFKAPRGPQPADLQAANDEIKMLNQYLSRCYNSRGGIKHLNPEIDKVYQALRQSLNRFLSACEDGKLRQYVEKHLNSGIYYGWK